MSFWQARALWMTAMRAGAAYFALVFAAGFVLGTIRTLFLAPAFGELAATLVELPVILTVAWLVCGWLIAHFKLPPRTPTRVVMGAVAFALLMGAEVALSVWLFGRTFEEFGARLLSPPGALGLVGQIVFAALPAVRR